jgi:fructose-1,6-bisphosphatase/sedoheptulose 1,7-bisphosphatase-like protein
MNVHNELLDNFDMEFVVSPVDGAAACYRGLAGALSVLAGGRPGSFRQPPNDWYLVIATAPGLVNEPEWNQKLRTALGHNTIDVSSAMDIFLTELFRTQVLAHNQPSFSTSTLLSFRKHDPLAAVCSKYSRMRVSTGSPIAHALAVYSFNPTFDMFAAVVKSGQASLIAAAARSTGGGFFAFPVTVQKKKADDVVAFVSDFVGDDHFVREDADVFLNATAISHCAVLEGVRFDERENNVVTQTLSLRSHTRSQRRLINLHNHAREKVFHLLDTTTLARLTKTYDEILAEVNELIK